MSYDKPPDLTVKPRDVRELFAEPHFDPFVDDPDTLTSVAQVPLLSDLTSRLGDMKLRVLLPHEKVTSETRVAIERALARYCARNIRDAQLQLVAWRRTALSALLYGLIFFGISLALSAAVLRATLIPESLRTLAALDASDILLNRFLDWQMRVRRPMEQCHR